MAEGFRSLHQAHEEMSRLIGQNDIEFTDSQNIELLSFSTVQTAFIVLARLADLSSPKMPFFWREVDTQIVSTTIADVSAVVTIREITIEQDIPVATKVLFQTPGINRHEIYGYFPAQYIAISGNRSDTGFPISYSVLHFESPASETDMCIVQEGDVARWSIDNPVFADNDQHLEVRKMLQRYIDMRRTV